MGSLSVAKRTNTTEKRGLFQEEGARKDFLEDLGAGSRKWGFAQDALLSGSRYCDQTFSSIVS